MKVKDGLLWFVDDKFREISFQRMTDARITFIEQNAQVFLAQLFASILFVLWIIPVSFFILLPVEPSEKLIDLFGLRIELAFVGILAHHARLCSDTRRQE